jgi:hypothetical protein
MIQLPNLNKILLIARIHHPIPITFVQLNPVKNNK